MVPMVGRGTYGDSTNHGHDRIDSRVNTVWIDENETRPYGWR
jgi:hypothetical protein